MAVPKGFGRTIKALIAQGYKPKDAMKEAWRLHRSSAPGMKKGPLYNPKRKRGMRVVARLRSTGLHARKHTSSGKNPIAIYNPSGKKKWTLLYGEVIEIKAIKTTGEHRGEPFRHIFATKVLALGLPNGDVLLQSPTRIRLWDFEKNIR